MKYNCVEQTIDYKHNDLVIRLWIDITFQECETNKVLETLNKTDNKDDNTIELTKMLTYILSLVNFVFILMIHISLVFFSTDEITRSIS